MSPLSRDAPGPAGGDRPAPSNARRILCHPPAGLVVPGCGDITSQETVAALWKIHSDEAHLDETQLTLLTQLLVEECKATIDGARRNDNTLRALFSPVCSSFWLLDRVQPEIQQQIAPISDDLELRVVRSARTWSDPEDVEAGAWHRYSQEIERQLAETLVKEADENPILTADDVSIKRRLIMAGNKGQTLGKLWMEVRFVEEAFQSPEVSEDESSTISKDEQQMIANRIPDAGLEKEASKWLHEVSPKQQILLQQRLIEACQRDIEQTTKEGTPPLSSWPPVKARPGLLKRLAPSQRKDIKSITDNQEKNIVKYARTGVSQKLPVIRRDFSQYAMAVELQLAQEIINYTKFNPNHALTADEISFERRRIMAKRHGQLGALFEEYRKAWEASYLKRTGSHGHSSPPPAGARVTVSISSTAEQHPGQHAKGPIFPDRPY